MSANLSKLILHACLAALFATLSGCDEPHRRNGQDASVDGDQPSDSEVEDAEVDDDAETITDAEIDSASPEADLDPEPLTELLGLVTYEARPISPSGLGLAHSTTSAGFTVSLMEGEPGVELAITETDEEGRFSFDIDDSTPEDVWIRVRARRISPILVQVTDFDTASYSVRTPRFDPRSFVMPEISIELGDNAGAFAIFSTMLRGVAVISEELSLLGPSPSLTVRWERGRSTPYGTSYSDGRSLWILGGPTDTDEFDSSVLLHELGHYAQMGYPMATFVPGDSHAGAETDPRLAFSEGWPTFFSCLVLDQPHYLDSYGDEIGLSRDISELPQEGEFIADPTAGMEQTLSEWIIAGTLYQLLEEIPNRAQSRGYSFGVFIGWFDREPHPDRGLGGYDLVDFLDGTICLYGDELSGVIQRYVIGERRFPYDMSPSCSAFGSGTRRTLSVETSPQGKPGRPPLAHPIVPMPDALDRGSLVRDPLNDELMREIEIPLRSWRRSD